MCIPFCLSSYQLALTEACVSSHGRVTCVMEDVVRKVRVNVISIRSYDGSGCSQKSSGEGKQLHILRLAQHCTFVRGERQGSQISTCPNNNGCLFLQVSGPGRRKC